MGLPGTVHMHAACTKHRYGVSKLLKTEKSISSVAVNCCGYFGRGGGVGTVSNCTCGGASRVKR